MMYGFRIPTGEGRKEDALYEEDEKDERGMEQEEEQENEEAK
jgi:hypothetical protein